MVQSAFAALMEMSRLPNPPSFVKKDKCEFLIMDAPTDYNIKDYIQELKGKKVRKIVRTCEPTYESDQLHKVGLEVIEAQFPDGQPPSDALIDFWLKVVEEECLRSKDGVTHPVAVHCVAGLGRSALLVAIALIELCKMPGADAAKLIRERRRGAINHKQFNYLKAYQRKRNDDCCVIL